LFPWTQVMAQKTKEAEITEQDSLLLVSSPPSRAPRLWSESARFELIPPLGFVPVHPHFLLRFLMSESVRRSDCEVLVRFGRVRGSGALGVPGSFQVFSLGRALLGVDSGCLYGDFFHRFCARFGVISGGVLGRFLLRCLLVDSSFLVFSPASRVILGLYSNGPLR
jgi:hypothetical protein